MAVYVIHFATKLHHAGHYVGWTNDVERRLQEHRANTGARLLERLNALGIGYQVVRIFPEGTRAMERMLKEKHNHRAICPLCREAYLAETRARSAAYRHKCKAAQQEGPHVYHQ